MKHRAPHSPVRIPLVGAVPTPVLLGVASGVGLVFASLLILLSPLVLANRDASAAADELQDANDALSSGDADGAHEALADAREHVDGAHGHLSGMAADMWSHFPVLGPSVDDGRHLVAALNQATVAATIGVDLVNRATSPDSPLIVGTHVNIDAVQRLAVRAGTIGPHLAAAQSEVDEVDGNDPLLGGKIEDLKDRAAAQLATTEKSYRQLRPLLDTLPEILGGEGPRTYLLTIMNPAEQRFSGGATLQMAQIRFDRGTITFGQSQSVADVDQAKPFLHWRPVKGNLFHPPGPTRLAGATYSPWWQVSGEEMLRAWQAQTGQRCQGLIAVDLQALAELFRITGPIQVKGYGELNADNLVRVLAGSYDKFQDPDARRRLNNALVPAFQQKFVGGGDLVEKARSLQQDAQGRHVALYFRDGAAESALARAGLVGNLSTTRHDYLGVFTQNLNGSKSDYWQARQVDSRIALQPDGSADEKLRVIVNNASPPYVQASRDPRTGYSTRWLGTLVSVFLPIDAQLEQVTGDGQVLPHESLDYTSQDLRGVVNRSMLRHGWLLGPRDSAYLTATYRVPHAATVDPDDGSMTYQIAVDPQDLVTAQSTSFTLTIPSGYRFGKLPDGWTATSSRTALLSLPQLTKSGSWDIPVLKD